MTKDQERDAIKRAVVLLFEVHSHKHTPQAVEHWVNKLERLAGSNLMRALSGALDAERMPSLNTITAEVGYRNRLAGDADRVVKPLTDEERARADKAAVLSITWAAHFKPKALGLLGGVRTLARVLGVPREQAVEVAKERYPAALCAAWMEDQERAGN